VKLNRQPARSVLSLFFATFSIFLFASFGFSQDTVDVSGNERASLWLVELASPPTIDGTSNATVKSEKQAFRTAAKQAGIKYTERFAYDRLFNGLSISIDPKQVPALTRIDGVKNVWPVQIYSLPPTTSTSDPDLITAITMSAPVIVIAVIRSGSLVDVVGGSE